MEAKALKDREDIHGGGFLHGYIRIVRSEVIRLQCADCKNKFAKDVSEDIDVV